MADTTSVCTRVGAFSASFFFSLQLLTVNRASRPNKYFLISRYIAFFRMVSVQSSDDADIWTAGEFGGIRAGLSFWYVHAVLAVELCPVVGDVS